MDRQQVAVVVHRAEVLLDRCRPQQAAAGVLSLELSGGVTVAGMLVSWVAFFAGRWA